MASRAHSTRAFLTSEDARTIFTMVCCFFGIGTLAMPSNFARAGPFYATAAMLLMAFANIYATVALSRVMLAAPASVQTFTDVGDWVCGKPGRYAVIVSQLLVCLLLPCAFLVLGSTLLDVLFPHAFSQTAWIVLMAFTVVPPCLIPTLNEAAAMAVLGCLGTFVADVVGVSVLQWELRGHPAVPAPDITLHQVLTTFGNLSLAYGASVVVPDLQRQHSDPTRMPRVILVSMGAGSAFFLVVAIVGYTAGGCQLSGNLLFSLVNVADPRAASALGRRSTWPSASSLACTRRKRRSSAGPKHRGASLANPATSDLEGNSYSASHTPPSGLLADHKRAGAAYTGKGVVLRYVTLRLSLIAVLVAASIGLRTRFLDLVDFTGASAVTVCCLALPILFYLKVFWSELPMYERVVACLLVVVCTIVGCYVLVNAGRNLFHPATDAAGVNFPYCSAEFQVEPYFVRKSTLSS
ncbi:unnamed protein product [Hyaloperonospora brassicae]|uniref:Amino acid transporter transmembrane domain-containing protein n=1 Tax=Hyaloperonospora brassicae TaxID=162125 RepID=A0AAV0SYU4_HYABA|nr:unnamed protein product [Hyaloperonospora brassicae]